MNQYKEIKGDDSLPMQLHISMRQRKQNLRKANVVMIENDGVVEPFNYKVATQNTEWEKTTEQEIQVLRQNKTWDISKTKRC